MIRRTVARAFGPSGQERQSDESGPPSPQASSRSALLNQFFTDLRAALERAAAEHAPRSEAGGGRLPSISVTTVRPRPDGLEFLLEGPAGSLRFLNSMGGIVRLYREEGRRFREHRLLTVNFEGGKPRIIERPVGEPRAPFRFTSIPELARELLKPHLERQASVR